MVALASNGNDSGLHHHAPSLLSYQSMNIVVSINGCRINVLIVMVVVYCHINNRYGQINSMSVRGKGTFLPLLRPSCRSITSSASP